MTCTQCGMDRRTNAKGLCHDCYCATTAERDDRCTCATLDSGGDCAYCQAYYAREADAEERLHNII